MSSPRLPDATLDRNKAIAPALSAGGLRHVCVKRAVDFGAAKITHYHADYAKNVKNVQYFTSQSTRPKSRTITPKTPKTPKTPSFLGK